MAKKRGGTELRQHATEYGVHGFRAGGHAYSEKGILKDVIKEIEEFKPDYVFLTETSATPWGFVLKEAYRRGYPDEKLPKFYRIDPSALAALRKKPYDRPKQSELKSKGREKLREFFKKRITKENPKVIIFDEMCGRSKSTSLVEESLKEYGIKSSDVKTILPYVKKNGEIVAGIEMYPHFKITSKEGSGTENPPRWEKEEDIRFTGKLVKGKSKKILDYIHDSKELGREIGDEIREEREKKKKLEGIVSGIIAVGGMSLSLALLGSNITGNAIADLSAKTNSIFGAGLLVIGLVAGFFWLKSKKK